MLSWEFTRNRGLASIRKNVAEMITGGPHEPKGVKRSYPVVVSGMSGGSVGTPWEPKCLLWSSSVANVGELWGLVGPGVPKLRGTRLLLEQKCGGMLQIALASRVLPYVAAPCLGERSLQVSTRPNSG